MRIYFLMLCLLAIGCKNHMQNINENKIVIGDADLKISHNLSEVVEDVQIIPLETHDSCLVGECNKITVTNEFIYILDSKSNRLFCFDKEGKFIRNIGEIGRAPNEYLSLRDYCILKNGNIALLDNYPNKLIIYNNLGEVEIVQRLPFCSDALEYLNDSVFVFNGSCTEDRVVIWNFKQKKRINSFVKYDERFSSRLLKTFIRVGDDLFWRREYHQELLCVKEHSLTVGRKIDFGKHNFTGEVVKGVMGLYFLPPDIADVSYYTENQDYIVFRFSCNTISEGTFSVFHSKKTKQTVVLNQEYFTDDITYYFPPCIETDTPDGRFVAVLESSWWLNHLEKIEKSDKNKPESFQVLKEKLKGVQFSDNPIVLLYNLK